MKYKLSQKLGNLPGFKDCKRNRNYQAYQQRYEANLIQEVFWQMPSNVLLIRNLTGQGIGYKAKHNRK